MNLYKDQKDNSILIVNRQIKNKIKDIPRLLSIKKKIKNKTKDIPTLSFIKKKKNIKLNAKKCKIRIIN